MPGEPPSRTTEPGTRPPPSTRSSSSMRVSRRSALGALTSRSGTGRGAAVACVRDGPPRRPPGPPVRLTSASVFHSPQPGQRPVHASAEWPHSWHTNWEPGEGMGALRLGTPPDGNAPPGAAPRAVPGPGSLAGALDERPTQVLSSLTVGDPGDSVRSGEVAAEPPRSLLGSTGGRRGSRFSTGLTWLFEGPGYMYVALTVDAALLLVALVVADALNPDPSYLPALLISPLTVVLLAAG